MEHNEPLKYEDKKGMYTFFFESEDGKLFRKLIDDMHSAELDIAQSAYLKLVSPNEQIVGAVSRAAGIKEVIDFINSIEAETKAHKKGEDQK